MRNHQSNRISRFLLAQLYFNSLIDKTSPKAITKTLQNIPKGKEALALAYDEAMLRVDGQKPNFREIAKNVLSWIF